MSVIAKVQSLLTSDDDGASISEYECADCGTAFESMKAQEDAKCMDCLSSDVRVTD